MSCPACGDDRREPAMSLDGVRLVRCRSCGLGSIDPMPTTREALALYQDSYFADPERGYVDYVADEEVFRREFRRRIRTIENAGAVGRMLEIGCATGVFLEEAIRRGFTVEGVEPAPGIAAMAAGRTGATVHATSIERALLPPAAFRSAAMFDVLEHLPQPVAALSTVRRALAPGGLLAVTVPDFGSLWARVCGRRWPLLTPWEHLFYYTRKSLYQLLRRSGFGSVRFAHARTVFSLATLVHGLGLSEEVLPRALAHLPVALPFGSLFALAAKI